MVSLICQLSVHYFHKAVYSAEWNYGALPYWLVNDPNIEFRTNNTAWMSWMETSVSKMVEVIKPYFLTNGGSVIALQVENEHGSIIQNLGERGNEYIRWSAKLLRKLAPELPSFLCDGAYLNEPKDVEDVVRSCNGRAT
jgi:hypothetical protein